jgi:outer membrane autotransporter protein
MTLSALSGHLLRPLLVLFGALLAQPALATINCEILPTGATTLSAASSSTAAVGVSVAGIGCTGYTITITETSPLSGTSVTPLTASGSGNATVNYSVNTGTVGGTYQFTATCTSGCFGSPSNTVINYTVNVTAPVVRTVAPTGPTTLTEFVGSGVVLQLRASDNGLPATGVAINWAISGPGTLSAPTSLTDNFGDADVFVNLGPGTGTVAVTGTRADAPSASVSYTINVLPPVVRTLVAISGNNQSGGPGTLAAAPLVVEAQDDGAPATGQEIAWSVVSGLATIEMPQNLTGSNGRASSRVRFGASVGAVVVKAERIDDGVAIAESTFNLTASIVRTITIVSGANQQGLAGLPLPQPIVVEVRANGLPEAGVAVDLSIAGGSATVTGDGPPDAKAVKVTGGDGRASFIVTLGATPGAVTLRTTLPADPGVTATVSANGSNLDALPNLPEPLQELGGILQGACAAIAAVPAGQRTAEQIDLLARCQDLAGGSPDQVADALDELLPDTSLAMISVALQAGQAQLDNIKGRIAALRSGSRSKFGGLAIASPAGGIPVSGLFDTLLGNNADEGEVGSDFERWGFFVSGTLGRGEADAGSLTPAYDFDINGLTAGADYRVNDQFILGGSIGYTKQDTDLIQGQGEVSATGYSLSAYGTYYRDQSWYSDAVVSWGRNRYDTQRRIRFTLTGPGGTSSVDRLALGDLDGDQLSLASTLGRDFQAGSWTVGTYGRLLYSRIAFDSSRETISGGAPGLGFALEVFPGTHTSLASVLGTKFSMAHSTNWGIVMPHMQLEWEREYKDDPQRVSARFLADPTGGLFTVQGDAIDNSFFRIGAGLSVLVSGGRSGFIYLERVVGKSGFTQTNLALGFRGEF